jgi:hypothetical protein
VSASSTPAENNPFAPVLAAEACDAWKRLHEEAGGNVCLEEAGRVGCPTLVTPAPLSSVQQRGPRGPEHPSLAKVVHGRKDPMVLAEHPVALAEAIGAHARVHYFDEGAACAASLATSNGFVLLSYLVVPATLLLLKSPGCGMRAPASPCARRGAAGRGPRQAQSASPLRRRV